VDKEEIIENNITKVIKSSKDVEFEKMTLKNVCYGSEIYFFFC
jgi:hypothetical protein